MTVHAWSIPDPIAGGFWLENPSRSGGVAQNGQEQNVSTLSMRQRAQWTVPLRNAADIRHARRLLALSQGKANSILVPVFEPQKGRAANVQAAAAARAIVLEITLSAGPAPEEGRHFSIANNNRAYLITTVTLVSGSHYQLKFFPPLRVGADIGDTVHFDTAVCEMNLTDDQTPVLLDVMRYATLELSFVEAF